MLAEVAPATPVVSPLEVAVDVAANKLEAEALAQRLTPTGGYDLAYGEHGRPEYAVISVTDADAGKYPDVEDYASGNYMG